jgi:hypothetical protein
MNAGTLMRLRDPIGCGIVLCDCCGGQPRSQILEGGWWYQGAPGGLRVISRVRYEKKPETKQKYLDRVDGPAWRSLWGSGHYRPGSGNKYGSDGRLKGQVRRRLCVYCNQPLLVVSGNEGAAHLRCNGWSAAQILREADAWPELDLDMAAVAEELRRWDGGAVWFAGVIGEFVLALKLEAMLLRYHPERWHEFGTWAGARYMTEQAERGAR